MKEESYILEAEHLIKRFLVQNQKQKTKEHQYLMAVNDVNLRIKKGEILSIVGESGCGKSTMGRCILKLISPSEGTLKFKGEDYTNASPKRMKELRKKMQIIFQNPYASFNPRLKIGKSLIGVLKEFKLYQGKERERIIEILEMVGMNGDALEKYPHQFSGGQLQRLAIARALLVEPEFLVADEPVSALDVSVQAQVVNLLLDLKEKLNLTILFVAHDLSVVEHISDRIAVMYLGRIVEVADVDELYQNPLHPYTKGLLKAIPIPDPRVENAKNILQGETPSPLNLPKGCIFKGRCEERQKECDLLTQEWNYNTPEHYCSCYFCKEQSGEVKKCIQ